LWQKPVAMALIQISAHRRAAFYASVKRFPQAVVFWLAARDRKAKRPRLTPKSPDPTPNMHTTRVGNDAQVNDCGLPLDGVVHAVRGAVVDVVFFGAELPPINSALVVEWDRPTDLILEVHSHLDQKTIRAVAFQSTAGLPVAFQFRPAARR
jgi:hypothetical protein